MRLETEHSIIKAAVNGQRYDESCKDITKRVVKHKKIQS